MPSPPHRSQHPPSPKELRAQAASPRQTANATPTPTRPAKRKGYLSAHWRGDIPLAAAVIISGLMIWLIVQVLHLLGTYFPITAHPNLAAILWLLEIAVLSVGIIWWGRGVQRAAMHHMDRGGSTLVAIIAALTGLAAFFWVGAFWWLSARHFAPEVWATLTGSTPPAAVHFDAQRGRLSVQGDLDFGSTYALRQAIDAHPAVRIVHLDSRGGRVKEGLAMGKLIRDRNLDTLVTAECSSACVTAFAGGARRMITASARLGLHSAGGAGASAQTIAQANQESDQFIAHRGVDWRILEKGAAVSSETIWFPPPYALLASGLATHYAHEVLPPNAL